MLVQYLILILVYVSVSCADEINDSKNNFGEYDREGSYVGDETERVSSSELSKLYMLVKNIESNLELSIEHKLKNVEKMIPELEDNMDRKLNRLEKKILDKLEDFIDSKVKGLKNDIPEKINDRFDALEKNNLINAELNQNFTLSVLEKQTTDIAKSVYRKFDTLDTTVTYKIKEVNIVTNDKLDKLFQKLAKNQNCTFDTLPKAGLNRMLDVLEEKIPSLEKNVTQKLDLLNKKLPGELEYNVTETLDAIVKKMSDLELTINRKFNEIENTFNVSFDNLDKTIYKNLTENVNGTMNALSKLFDLRNSTNSKLNVSYTSIHLDDKKLNGTDLNPWESRCKKVTYSTETFYSMDNNTFNHIKLRKSDNSLTADFEMNIVLKSVRSNGVVIYLSPVPETPQDVLGYTIVLDTEKKCVTLHDVNMWSFASISHDEVCKGWVNSRFMPFYIKIHNGKLEVGQAGNPPLIAKEAYDLYLMKYFRIFHFSDSTNTTAYFDCPAG